MALSDMDKRRAIAALAGQTSFVGIDDANELPETDQNSQGGRLATEDPVIGGTPAPSFGIVQSSEDGKQTGRVINLAAPGADPGPLNEGKASTGLSSDLAGGALAEADLDRRLLDLPIAPRPKPVIESGENFAAVGGARGRERFGQATDTSQTMAVDALTEGAAVQEKEAKDLERFYKGEQDRASGVQAFVQQRRMADEQEELKRIQELDSKAKMYSQNLSDRGAFWKNPGNIVAAIGFALMPFASEDKTIGVKLLNNAINEDFNQRKQLADMNLGELRSNLQGYRQIAKDKQAGDLLAQAEAYRIASMEVQRIAANYQGEKSQAAAKALTADLLNRSNMSAMQAYRQMVYLPPTAMQGQLRDAYRNQPGYQSFQPGAPQRQVMQPVYDEAGNIVDYRMPQPTGKPMGQGATGGTGAVSQTANTGKYAGLLETGGIKGPRSPDDVALDQMEQRSPGISNLIKTFKDNLTLWAVSSVKDPQLHPEEVRTKRAELLQNIKAKTDKISAAMGQQENAMAGTSMFQKDIRDIEAAFGGNERAINDFLGMMKGYPGETGINNFLSKSGWDDDKQKRNRDALMRFSQVMNANINSYYRQTSGGAVTAPEQSRLEKVVAQNSPFGQIKSFANDLSRRHASEIKNALAGQDSLAAQYYLIRKGQQFPELNSPGSK